MEVVKFGPTIKQNVYGMMYQNIKRKYGLHIQTEQITITHGDGEIGVKNYGIISHQIMLTRITEGVVGTMMI